MMGSPPILALILGSVLIAGFSLVVSVKGIEMVWAWDLSDSSVKQLRRERKTYLLSSLVSHVMAIQLFTIVLYVAIADSIHEFFTGAMCAAGSLNANHYGYATLFLMLFTCMLSAFWLVINFVDVRAIDYPLIRIKYLLLAILAPALVVQTTLLVRYFLELDPNIITSCCGTIFDGEVPGLAGGLSALPPTVMKPLFWAAWTTTLVTGFIRIRSGKFCGLYAIQSGFMLPISIASIISFFSLYIYELPTHHCPFCLLQQEYGYVGYVLYLSLFGASVLGMASGMIRLFRRVESLRTVIPLVERRLCLVSLSGFLVFGLVAGWPLVFSDFKL